MATGKVNGSGSIVNWTPTIGWQYSEEPCTYRKEGNVVTVTIEIAGLTYGQNNDVYTLPAGFRPKDTIKVMGYGNATNELACFNIYADGTIMCYPNSNGGICRGTAVFAAAQ